MHVGMHARMITRAIESCIDATIRTRTNAKACVGRRARARRSMLASMQARTHLCLCACLQAFQSKQVVSTRASFCVQINKWAKQRGVRKPSSFVKPLFVRRRSTTNKRPQGIATLQHRPDRGNRICHRVSSTSGGRQQTGP